MEKGSGTSSNGRRKRRKGESNEEGGEAGMGDFMLSRLNEFFNFQLGVVQRTKEPSEET